MSLAIKKSSLTLIIVIVCVVLASALIITTVLILNNGNKTILQTNKAATSYQQCGSIDIPNSAGPKQLTPVLTLLNNGVDTVDASILTVHGDANASYRVFYASYTGKGGTPVWIDGYKTITMSASGTATYTPTIPQPHASFFSPNAYSYMYTFVKQDTNNDYVNFANTSTGFTTPDKSDASNQCVAWTYVNRVQCHVLMHKQSDGSLVANNGTVDGSDKINLSINWTDLNGVPYTMPVSTDPNTLDFKWVNKINTGDMLWHEFGDEKNPLLTSDMNYGGSQTFTKTEYSLNVYGSDSTAYRIGPDISGGYNQPSCYGVLNVNRIGNTPVPSTVITTPIPNKPLQIKINSYPENGYVTTDMYKTNFNSGDVVEYGMNIQNPNNSAVTNVSVKDTFDNYFSQYFDPTTFKYISTKTSDNSTETIASSLNSNIVTFSGISIPASPIIQPNCVTQQGPCHVNGGITILFSIQTLKTTSSTSINCPQNTSSTASIMSGDPSGTNPVSTPLTLSINSSSCTTTTSPVSTTSVTATLTADKTQIQSSGDSINFNLSISNLSAVDISNPYIKFVLDATIDPSNIKVSIVDGQNNYKETHSITNGSLIINLNHFDNNGIVPKFYFRDTVGILISAKTLNTFLQNGNDFYELLGENNLNLHVDVQSNNVTWSVISSATSTTTVSSSTPPVVTTTKTILPNTGAIEDILIPMITAVSLVGISIVILKGFNSRSRKIE